MSNPYRQGTWKFAIICLSKPIKFCIANQPRDQQLVTTNYKLNFTLLFFQMQRKVINELRDYPASPNYQSTKVTLNSIIEKLNTLEKDKALQNKELYLNTFKQISWSINKCSPNWPAEVQQMVQKLKSQCSTFETTLMSHINSKNKFTLCGGNNNKPVKQDQFDSIYKKIVTYQQIFFVIGVYQQKKIREDIVYNVFQILQKYKTFNQPVSKLPQVTVPPPVFLKQNKKQQEKETEKSQMCNYCQLMKAVSVSPNGYIAKKLLHELDNVEWIAGILYEEGKIVDKNLKKAIQFYEKGRKKNNPQAIYRLGLLNQKKQYGKPNQYIKMWEQAAKMGHLQSMTDLGFLYQNGLEDEDDQKTIISPNSEKAFKYYSKAVEKSFPRALNNLASFFYNDPKYKNQKKCMQYFQLAAEAEYVKALYNLGIIYLQGDYCEQNQEKAKALIKRSAEKGDLQGKQQYVQMMLSEHHKCSHDDLLEINMYCRQIIAQQEDNPYPYYFLGIMYEGGYGVPQQPKTALLYYTKASRYQCPEAYIKLGDCFKNGFGVQQNSKDAIRNYQKAATNLPEANIFIGQIYEKGFPDLKPNYQLAFNHYYTACNHQIPQAYIHIGNMYKQGRHVPKNDGKAQQYFSKAKNSIKKSNFNRLGSSSQLIQSSYFRGGKK